MHAVLRQYLKYFESYLTIKRIWDYLLTLMYQLMAMLNIFTDNDGYF